MIKRANSRPLILLLSSVAVLAGCTNPGKNVVPPGGDMSMAQIYHQETGQSSQQVTYHMVKGKDGKMHKVAVLPKSFTLKTLRHAVIGPLPKPNYVAYTATAQNQVNSLFKPLPNPEIPMYIYPHLVQVGGEGYPKPGLTTDFFLYKDNHFALPYEPISGEYRR